MVKDDNQQRKKDLTFWHHWVSDPSQNYLPLDIFYGQSLYLNNLSCCCWIFCYLIPNTSQLMEAFTMCPALVSPNPQHTESGLFVYTSDSHIRPWIKMAKDGKEERESAWVCWYLWTSDHPGNPSNNCLCEIISCLNSLATIVEFFITCCSNNLNWWQHPTMRQAPSYLFTTLSPSPILELFEGRSFVLLISVPPWPWGKQGMTHTTQLHKESNMSKWWAKAQTNEWINGEQVS